MAQHNETDVWITGIGIVSSLGEGVAAHAERLGGGKTPQATVDEAWFPPYPIHDLVEIDFSKQIPKRSDQRQMEMWQRIGTYAAGLALDDAGIAGNEELLDRVNLNVAAGSGERDTSVDKAVLDKIAEKDGSEILANEILPGALRPTLFLAQLSNLLAGNISIVHHVTGASRTFMGEEMAGIAAIEDAYRRIRAGQGEVFLVGGALNARREDLLLNFELGQYLWAEPFRPVWDRTEGGGGIVLGSAGAFVVLEAAAHARARGAEAYARIGGVASDRSKRTTGAIATAMQSMFANLGDVSANGELAVLSGASGAQPAIGEEQSFLQQLQDAGHDVAVRAYGSIVGHTMEAHFPAGVALAAIALRQKAFFPPFDQSGVERDASAPPDNILVTSVGSWRGEALALIEASTN